jgi:hypothetical protein
LFLRLETRAIDKLSPESTERAKADCIGKSEMKILMRQGGLDEWELVGAAEYTAETELQKIRKRIPLVGMEINGRPIGRILPRVSSIQGKRGRGK